MKCRVDGCDMDAQYKGEQLCQKHYFRLRRNGHLELALEIKRRELGYTRKNRVTMPGKGYQRVYDPEHALADSGGYVSEHRKVVYQQYGEVLPPCQLCGASINWATCHVDHIDFNVKNNDPGNLRPLCNACNTRRVFPDQHTITGHWAITFDGETKTPAEWERDPRVSVTGGTIKRRKAKGMSDCDALFSEKITHNGNPYIDRRPKKTNAKHERSNSLPITIDGVTLTAAEWSRDIRCFVTENTILNRVRSGWGHFDAVFSKPRSKPGCQSIEQEFKAKLKGLRERETA